MTRKEAEAVAVVLDWIFSVNGGTDRELFKSACLLLAQSASQKGERWNQERILAERWW